MPFTVIRGTFRPDLGQMDGDSVRFMPDKPQLILDLPRARKSTLKADGTAQLRYEGIDAIEKGATPSLAKLALEANRKLLGVSATVSHPRGYILSRTCETNGRPVSFCFTGTPPAADGASVRLEPALMRKSVNTAIVRSGFAYPLFYTTLFAELRTVLVDALRAAQQGSGRGYWPTDLSTKGFKVASRADAKTLPPIFPKLWRRLFSDFKGDLADLSSFIAFVRSQDERLHTLSDGRFIAFDDVLKLKSGKLRMVYAPHDLVFVPA